MAPARVAVVVTPPLPLARQLMLDQLPPVATPSPVSLPVSVPLSLKAGRSRATLWVSQPQLGMAVAQTLAVVASAVVPRWAQMRPPPLLAGPTPSASVVRLRTKVEVAH